MVPCECECHKGEPQVGAVVIIDETMVFQRKGRKEGITNGYEWFMPGNRMAFSWEHNLAPLNPTIIWEPSK